MQPRTGSSLWCFSRSILLVELSSFDRAAPDALRAATAAGPLRCDLGDYGLVSAVDIRTSSGPDFHDHPR